MYSFAISSLFLTPTILNLPTKQQVVIRRAPLKVPSAPQSPCATARLKVPAQDRAPKVPAKKHASKVPAKKRAAKVGARARLESSARESAPLRKTVTLRLLLPTCDGLFLFLHPRTTEVDASFAHSVNMRRRSPGKLVGSYVLDTQSVSKNFFRSTISWGRKRHQPPSLGSRAFERAFFVGAIPAPQRSHDETMLCTVRSNIWMPG